MRSEKTKIGIMKNNNGIIKVEKGQVLKIDHNTGLMIAKSYRADSGFEYALGMREFGNLRIMEEVGQGTAVTYLNGVKVFDGKGELIIDEKLGKSTYYSRETVRQVVLEAILNMLENAATKTGKNYDRDKTKEVINNKLEAAYYGQSYTAVLEWAEEIGVEFI